LCFFAANQKIQTPKLDSKQKATKAAMAARAVSWLELTRKVWLGRGSLLRRPRFQALFWMNIPQPLIGWEEKQGNLIAANRRRRRKKRGANEKGIQSKPFYVRSASAFCFAPFALFRG
jgi:hypothetical protein